MNIKTISLVSAAVSAILLGACNSAQDTNGAVDVASAQLDKRPNILLIVTDDMGYTDLGVYGGEIETPNIDQLGRDGLILTDFHNQAVCAPTRAALLAGTDEHNAGGSMHVTPNQRGVPGYEAELNDAVVSFPAMLQDAGYKTYWAGKWHLGSGEGQRPFNRGFDKAFTLISSGASHFEDMRGMFDREPLAHYSLNGEDVTLLPEGFYSTTNYTDFIIDSINDDRGLGEPWMALVGYTAPHWPLHAPDDKIAKYKGKYDAGYEVLRAERTQRAKDLGIFDADAPSFKRLDDVAPWDSLSDEQKAIKSKEMEIYAGMVDSIDENVGRLVSYLKDTGQYENTFIMFISDNGAEGTRRDPGDNWGDWTFDNSLENMGRTGSHIYYGPEWAQAGVGPMRYYKSLSSEGGTRGPAIIHYPAASKKGVISDAFSSVIDIAPTALELAGYAAPDSFNGRDVQELQGSSMMPYVAGDASYIHPDDEAWGWEIFGHRAIRKGDWKLLWLSTNPGDVTQFDIEGTDSWGLYDMATDPGEVNDVSDAHPEIVADLIEEWGLYVERNGIILPVRN